MIEVKHVSVSYGSAPVLLDCSLNVPAGAHAALTGPSGCGKTTLLRCVAGLTKPEAGSVTVHGRVSVVFQEPRLFPWLTAAQNIEAVLTSPRPGAAAEWLERAGLPGEAAGKYPSELSGGMCQRLSICRALACGGDVLLLDEPLKGMDAPLRREICELLRRESAGRTLLLVTHDEADLALADTVYAYCGGQFYIKT